LNQCISLERHISMSENIKHLSINIVDNMPAESIVNKGIITLASVFVLTAKHCVESTDLHRIKVCTSYIE
jgi:hypothetical protein